MVRTRFLVIMAVLGAALLLLVPGCDELITETIEVTIAGHPTAEFHIADSGILGDSGCLDNNNEFLVVFEDASTGPIVRWVWNFGDSTFDTLYLDSGESGDISHTYDRIGSYTVTLAVFDSLNGADLEIKKRAIIVGHSIDSMTVSDTIICPGDSVTLTAHNPFGVTSWSWHFGEGAPPSTDSNPVQKYAWSNPGEYEVKLSVNGDCGQTIIIDTVSVQQCAVPCFTFEPTQDCGTLTTTFTNCTDPAVTDSTGATVAAVVSWLYDFGIGTPVFYDHDPLPELVTYPAEGTYEVSLTVTTDLGGVTTFYDTVIVYPEDAQFTAAPAAGCQWTPGLQHVVAFKRVAAGDFEWSWDFGDGSTDTVQNPYHSYANPGVYDVTLTVKGVCGDTSATTKLKTAMISFDDALADTSRFSAVQDVDSLFKFTFTDTTAASAVVYRYWDFGDDLDDHPTATSVQHEFEDTGLFWVKLSRYNTCDSVADSIEILVDTTGGGK